MIRVLSVVILSACATQSVGRMIEINASRTVHCGPGWTLSVNRHGASQNVKDTCVRPREYQTNYDVTQRQWDAVRNALEIAQFDTLPGRIVAPALNGRVEVVTDDDDLCITVKQGAIERTVCGQAHPLSVTPDGARFLKVWTALTAIAPEPK